MRYNVETRELFTNEGTLIKKMYCPIDVNWEKMEPGKNDLERICRHCNKSVIDTDFLTDEEILFLLNQDRDRCIKINSKKI
jgi:hypothetical protein